MHKIETRTLHQEVVDQVREMIRRGQLVKGQKVDERFLCESMGVSRTPVRESLRMLHSEGLIDLVPHRGAFVREPPIEEIKDMFEVMSLLEGMCARVATQKMTEKDLKKIEALHQKIEGHYGKRDHESYLDANNVLHTFIQELSGNKTLNEVITGLRQKILLYRHRQLYHQNRFEESIQEHRDILEAFRMKDAARAEASMERHLMKQCEALIELYAHGPAEDR